MGVYRDVKATTDAGARPSEALTRRVLDLMELRSGETELSEIIARDHLVIDEESSKEDILAQEVAQFLGGLKRKDAVSKSSDQPAPVENVSLRVPRMETDENIEQGSEGFKLVEPLRLRRISSEEFERLPTAAKTLARPATPIQKPAKGRSTARKSLASAKPAYTPARTARTPVSAFCPIAPNTATSPRVDAFRQKLRRAFSEIYEEFLTSEKGEQEDAAKLTAQVSHHNFSPTSLSSQNSSENSAKRDRTANETNGKDMNKILTKLDDLESKLKGSAISLAEEKQTSRGSNVDVQERSDLTEIEKSPFSLVMKDLAKTNMGNVFAPYQLNDDMRMDQFVDLLKAELYSKGLWDVIDENFKIKDYPPEQMKIRKELVRNLLNSRLSGSYHSKLMHITDPKLALDELWRLRSTQSNIATHTVRNYLHSLKCKSADSFHAYIEKLENTIKSYERCPKARCLSETEKYSLLVGGVAAVFPELMTQIAMRDISRLPEMTYDEVKQYCSQLSDPKVKAGRFDDKSTKPKANFAKSNRSKTCFRCGNQHPGPCKYENSGLRLCYNCHQMTTHLAADCKLGKKKGRKFHRGNKFRNHSDKKRNWGKRKFSKRKIFKKRKETKREKGKDDRNKPKASLAFLVEGNDPPVPQALKLTLKSKYNNNYVNFIADSGATNHFVNNKNWVREIRQSPYSTIKSANRDRKADIRVEGEGSMFVETLDRLPRQITLPRVIISSALAENLLSLREFVDQGLGVYLDNRELKIMCRNSRKVLIRGVYKAPNWEVGFNVLPNRPKYSHPKNSHSYYATYIAKLTSVNKDDTKCKADRVITRSEGAMRETNESSDSNDSESESGGNENIVSDDIETVVKVLDVDKITESDGLKDFSLLENTKSRPRDWITPSPGMLWHYRLGHASLEYMRRLKSNPEYKNIQLDRAVEDCETCKLAKLRKLPFIESRNRADRPLHTLHTDVIVRIKPESYPGKKSNIVVFIDDYSRYAKAYCVRSKDQTYLCFRSYIKSARNLLGYDAKVCYVRSDQGTEYTGQLFVKELEKDQIESKMGPPKTPQHNGVAERFNGTLQNKVRALMFDSKLPASMWEFAVDFSVHLYNRTPHRSNDFKSPLSLFAPNEKAHFDYIKRFGCLGYILAPKTKKSFAPKALKAFLVGFSTTGYIFWHPTTHKFLESKHVSFNEKLVYGDLFRIDAQKEKNILMFTTRSLDEKDSPEGRGPQNLEIGENKDEGIIKRKRKVEQSSSDEDELDNEIKARASNLIIDSSLELFYPQARLAKIENLKFYDPVGEKFSVNDEISDEVRYALLASVNQEPKSYQEAIKSNDYAKWKGAIKDELSSMLKNNVWQIVERPKSEGKKARRPNIIDSRWVFKRKIEKDGQPKFKARLVIRGFKDKNEYDLKEIYAPVSRLPLVRALLSIANKHGLHLCQLDVKTAFLNGELNEDVFMEIPEGFECSLEFKKQNVCKLVKALYGLKVSPRKWNLKFTETVKEIGLENDLHEPCLFTWRDKGRIAILLLYVDDILLASNDKNKMGEIKGKLMASFEMTDMGEPSTFLGISLVRNKANGHLLLHQKPFIKKILETFNMTDVRKQGTPMVTRQAKKKRKTDKLPPPIEVENNKYVTVKCPYRAAIGSLLYLSGGTRPDIAYAVGKLAQKQSQPTSDDWCNVKRVFRYLMGTMGEGILYKGQKDDLAAYSDASFRDDASDGKGKTTFGFIIRLYGDAVAWRSTKTRTVVLSTCEAEYVAMSEAVRELVSLDKAIRYMVGKTFYPFTIYTDNKAAKQCTEKDGSHRLKSFDDSIEEIREKLAWIEHSGGSRRHISTSHADYVKLMVQEDKVKVKWVPTNENLADILTKPLPEVSHKMLTELILCKRLNSLT